MLNFPVLANYPSFSSASSSKALADLVIGYSNSMQGRSYRREDCSCIVAVSNIFLRSMVLRNLSAEPDWHMTSLETVSAVVQIMISVAETALERSYANCGSYRQLPWLSTFTLCNFWLVAPKPLCRLLELLERSEEKGLLADEVKEELAHARGVIAHFEADAGAARWDDQCHFDPENSGHDSLSMAVSPSSSVVPGLPHGKQLPVCIPPLLCT